MINIEAHAALCRMVSTMIICIPVLRIEFDWVALVRVEVVFAIRPGINIFAKEGRKGCGFVCNKLVSLKRDAILYV